MHRVLLATLVLNIALNATATQPVSHCPAEEDIPATPAGGPAAATPFGAGLFFRIEKPGVAATHIFGTIHLDYPNLLRLPPQVNLALLRSDRLVMETLLDDAAQATFSQQMVLKDDQSLSLWLGGDVLSRYDRLLAHYEVPQEVGRYLRPWAATSLIGRPKPSTGRIMEDVLRDTAIQMGKPVFGLETMAELVDAQEEQPLDEQVAVLVDTICQHRRVMSDTGELIALYGNGDLAGIAAQNEAGHEDDPIFQRMNERMLYQRSARMVERLQPHLMAGNALIAVGALHLTGERGILRLLEKQGYTITREF
jgi:uncharacterized protein YbaP (TraB family)